MGNLGVKFRAIFQLERSRNSKVRDDLLKEKVQECFCSFIGNGGMSPPTPRRCPLTQEVFDLFNSGHMSKVKLPVNFWERLPGQENRKSGATVSGVGVRY